MIIQQLQLIALSGCILWAKWFGENKYTNAGVEYDALAYFSRFFPAKAKEILDREYPVVNN